MNNQKSSVVLRAIYSYVVSIVLALIFMPPFKSFYETQFHPVKFNSMFSLWGYQFDIVLTGFLFAFILFLPLLIFIFVQRKQWLVWIIGVIIPAILILSGGKKYILWFAIFTVAGALIGWLISLLLKKFKKS